MGSGNGEALYNCPRCLRAKSTTRKVKSSYLIPLLLSFQTENPLTQFHFCCIAAKKSSPKPVFFIEKPIFGFHFLAWRFITPTPLLHHFQSFPIPTANQYFDPPVLVCYHHHWQHHGWYHCCHQRLTEFQCGFITKIVIFLFGTFKLILQNLQRITVFFRKKVQVEILFSILVATSTSIYNEPSEPLSSLFMTTFHESPPFTSDSSATYIMVPWDPSSAGTLVLQWRALWQLAPMACQCKLSSHREELKTSPVEASLGYVHCTRQVFPPRRMWSC